MSDIPRRANMWEWTPAEKAIFDAMQSVEAAGAHPLLTDAVILLSQARGRVADFVEGNAEPTSKRVDGVGLIDAERQRQQEQEGYTTHHDDLHVNGELAQAAAAYALGGPVFNAGYALFPLWPWDAASFKGATGDRISELVKAGALIAAEIDRLNRRRETEG